MLWSSSLLHCAYLPPTRSALPPRQVVFESHPREWTDHAPAWLYAGASDAAQLRPFMRFQVAGAARAALPCAVRIWWHVLQARSPGMLVHTCRLRLTNRHVPDCPPSPPRLLAGLTPGL